MMVALLISICLGIAASVLGLWWQVPAWQVWLLFTGGGISTVLWMLAFGQLKEHTK
jgi:ABC-type arginine/histidine transport system permease subunit